MFSQKCLFRFNQFGVLQYSSQFIQNDNQIQVFNERHFVQDPYTNIMNKIRLFSADNLKLAHTKHRTGKYSVYSLSET
jgi:hypothetical protein